MKKLLIAAMVVLLSAPAFAFPMIQEGARELELDFFFDNRDNDWAVRVGYGVFMTDNILVKGSFEYIDDFVSIWAVGAEAEYNWNMGTMTVPYVGVMLQYVDFDVDTMFMYGPKVGIKQFITDYLAIDLHARYLFSDEDAFDEDIEILGGLRVLF